MTAFWHAIWPGWTAIAAQVFVGIITLPVMLGGQLLVMRVVNKLKKHVAELTEFNRALTEENEALQKRLVRNSRIEKREQRERPDAFRGW